jgi:cysteinyl-tRNA synthetase
MSDLTLFNTLTRRHETFTPLEEGKVKMYCCGPTVYNNPHIGNLRTFLWCDVLRRYLQWKGYAVTQVMNLTDVEDKIIRNAAEKGLDIGTYTRPFIEAFFGDLETLRIRPADLYPKATEHIDEMVDLVEKLTKNGHTYVVDGSTYFRISTLPGYGKLAQLELAEESAFHRVESDEYEKESARDFVLWKAKKEGEPSWDTAIGDGRPGWHLECSAMSMKYLGETFDIHTGAVDLIFPHHENEVAQSEGATGKPFVRYWVHGEHLIMDDQKMSKSLGNVFLLKDLLDEGYSPLEIRYALVSVPYRTKLNFSKKSLDDAKSALERLESFMLRLGEAEASGGPEGDGHQGGKISEALLADFERSMDDDLNTAGALGALFTAVRETNTAIDQGMIGPADARVIREAVEKVDDVLDVVRREAVVLDEEIERMIQARIDARKARNFAEADRLRDGLQAMGIILEDTAGGTRWRRK